MDDDAALSAWPVATAASAWLRAKADTEAYRRLVVSSAQWDAYVAPPLDGGNPPEASDLVLQLRRAARQALPVMDDDAAALAWRVAETASVWLHQPTDPETYRRFVAAIEGWDAYAAPQLGEPVEELLDQLGEDSPPVAVGEIMAEVASRIGAPAHRDF